MAEQNGKPNKASRLRAKRVKSDGYKQLSKQNKVQLFAYKLACHRDKSTCKKLNRFEKEHNLPLTEASHDDNEGKKGTLCNAVPMDKSTKEYV